MVSKAALVIPIAVGAAGVSLYAYLGYQRRNRVRDTEKHDKYEGKDLAEHRMILNGVYANLVLEELPYIRMRTSTLIKVLHSTNEDNSFGLLMKGTPKGVHDAEDMVNSLIENTPEMATSVMEVPEDKLKLIVGDFGNKILSVTQETGSKVFLKCDPDFYEASVLKDPDVVDKLSNDYFAVSPFSIEIQGPRENNALAYEMIRQALLSKPSATTHSFTNKWDDIPKETPLEIINYSQGCNYVEVIISSISTVNKFYVQIYRLNSYLIKMEERLSDRCRFPARPWEIVKKPRVGAMIAVPYKDQGKWHRAKIIYIGEKHLETSTVNVLFVDYGEVEDVKLDEVRYLSSEFKEYPFFAVECCLAGVKSKIINSQMEEEWSEEALDYFESLVSNKTIKIIMARKCGVFNTRPVGDGGNYLIPSLELFDTNTTEDIDIAHMLVSKGYADFCTAKEKQPLLVEEPRKRYFERNYDDYVMTDDGAYESDEECIRNHYEIKAGIGGSGVTSSSVNPGVPGSSPD